MAFTNYYKVLEVERSATVDEIRTAYRKLALQYHEDFSKSEEDKTAFHNIMVEINKAWEVFNDPEKREKYNQEYDEYFPPPPRGASPNPPPGRSYQQQYTPPNPPPFTPPPPPPRTPPGGAYQQHYAPPNPPPQTPPRWGYGQSYAPPMAPTAEAKQKRNKRIVVGGMGGGAIGGAGAFGIQTAILLAGHSTAGTDVLIRVTILEAVVGGPIVAAVGAIAGAAVGAVALVLIRILAGKEVAAFSRRKEVIIVLIAGILAGAVLPLGESIGELSVIAVIVGAGVVAGAEVAGIVRKKS